MGYALNGYVGGGLSGNWPPCKNNLKLAMRVIANLTRGHVAAYHAIHQIQPEARVGLALNYGSLTPQRAWSPLDRLLTRNADTIVNKIFPLMKVNGVIHTSIGTMRIPEAKGTQDFYGFNYYTRNRITFDVRHPETFFTNYSYEKDAGLSDKGFLANEPDGMFEGLKWIVRTFPNLPIIITKAARDPRKIPKPIPIETATIPTMMELIDPFMTPAEDVPSILVRSKPVGSIRRLKSG